MCLCAHNDKSPVDKPASAFDQVNVDVRDAGQGRLHWTIEGAGHVETKNAGLIGNAYKLYYRTNSPGEYILKLKWDDQEVQGSPFHIRVI